MEGRKEGKVGKEEREGRGGQERERKGKRKRMGKGCVVAVRGMDAPVNEY